MKSFLRVCVHRESIESGGSRIVYSPWKMEFEVIQDECLKGHERQ